MDENKGRDVYAFFSEGKWQHFIKTSAPTSVDNLVVQADNTELDKEERVEYLFKLLKPTLKKSQNVDWSTYRYSLVTFGTKTDEGMKAVIMRIMYGKEALPKQEDDS